MVLELFDVVLGLRSVVLKLRYASLHLIILRGFGST